MKIPRCTAVIYKRDTYRYTGRTKSGFEMHYAKQQCARRAVFGGLCTQHSQMNAVERTDWHPFMTERGGAKGARASMSDMNDKTKWLRLYAQAREVLCSCNVCPEQGYNDICQWCAEHPEGDWDQVEAALTEDGLSHDEPFLPTGVQP